MKLDTRGRWLKTGYLKGYKDTFYVDFIRVNRSKTKQGYEMYLGNVLGRSVKLYPSKYDKSWRLVFGKKTPPPPLVDIDSEIKQYLEISNKELKKYHKSYIKDYE